VTLALAALAFGVVRAVRSARTGEAAAEVWFYDESEQQLYAVPHDMLPPHRGIGGRSGDGVRAVVFTSRAERNDTAGRRIAYLETYGPELKKVLEEIRHARAAHRPYHGRVPDRESAFVRTNTLVRRLDDPTWHPSSSPDGERIRSEWQHWRDPDGQPGVVSVP